MQNRIRELREQRGLSLEQLAARAGTTNQQVSRLEKGQRRLTDDWLRRLAEALQVHPVDLLSDLALPPDESELLRRYRNLSEAQRQALLATARAFEEPDEKRKGYQ
ncbi:MAG: helix-turn-helix domain-containing protein [Rhodospirillales bacterium]|nr:helix-turn-helix domain-containing protein [Rhodospirillales bacterium]